VVLGGEFVYPVITDNKTKKKTKLEKLYREMMVTPKKGEPFTKYQMVMRVEDVSTSSEDGADFMTIETGSLDLAQSVRPGANYEVMGSLKIGRKDGKTYVSVRPKTIEPTGT